MKMEVYVKTMEVVVDESPTLLTADKAREISAEWQNNEIGKAVERTLSRIEENARLGAREAIVNLDRFGLNMDIALYANAVRNLGYELKHRSGYWFTWKW